jgi:hypothetical protein
VTAGDVERLIPLDREAGTNFVNCYELNLAADDFLTDPPTLIDTSGSETMGCTAGTGTAPIVTGPAQIDFTGTVADVATYTAVGAASDPTDPTTQACFEDKGTNMLGAAPGLTNLAINVLFGALQIDINCEPGMTDPTDPTDEVWFPITDAEKLCFEILP